jgi:integrase
MTMTDFTAAEAIELVNTWPDVEPKELIDLTSAVRTAAKVAGLSPGALSLAPPGMRAKVLNRSGASFGVTSGRMANIRSHLKTVAERLGVIDTEVLEISDAWHVALALLDDRTRRELTRLARSCSGKGVEPADVGLGVLLEFLSDLELRTYVRKPRDLVGATWSAWKRAKRAVPQWPGQKLPPLPRPGDDILPLAALTEALQADLARFRAKLVLDPLDETYEDDFADEQDEANRPRGNRGRICRPISADARVGHGRWAASALVQAGVPVGHINSLADLVSPPDHFRRILKYILRRNDNKPSSRSMHVWEVLLIIAKHYARQPDCDIRKLRGWSKRVVVPYDGLTEKNFRTMQDMMDPARIERLILLPTVLMEAALKLKSKGKEPVKAARIAFRAVSLALLLYIPMRESNVLDLKLGEHFHRAGVRRDRITNIMVDGSATKNRVPEMRNVPPELSKPLEAWLEHFREEFGSPGNPYLLPSPVLPNSHMSAQAFRDLVRAETKQHLGTAMTPHQFRHFAAHFKLALNPQDYEGVRQLLGHKKLETVMRSYAGCQAAAALDSYHQHLRDFNQDALRKDLTRGTSSSTPRRAGRA